MASMNSSPENKVLTIAAFGDSITGAVEVPVEQRWTSLLEKVLTRQISEGVVKVVNYGVGGNTSREGLARMEEIFSCGPDFVLVEFGGNDAMDNPERFVSLDEFTENLRTMQQRIEAAGAKMILLTFPPVVNEWHAHGFHPPHQQYGGLDGRIELYRQRTHTYAVENQLLLIDIDRALRHPGLEEGWEEYILPDGVHLTQGGNRIVAEKVLRELGQIGIFH